MTPQWVDVARLCREVLAEVRSATERAHDLVLSLADDPLDFVADQKVLRQIIGNLLTNAVKYSPGGGRVTLEAALADDKLVLRVNDQGIGIPATDRENLFEAFHRGTNVGKIPGSGLGLAITHNGVALHGGTITVDSTVDVGTTFEVRIPRMASPDRR